MKKNPRLKKSNKIIICLLLILVIMLAVYLVWRDEDNPSGYLSLEQGTQMRYEDILIGLINVDDDAAWLAIRKDGDSGESLTESLSEEETLNAYGYTIEIKSIEKDRIPSWLPGSGNGKIEFVINKE